MTALLPHNLWGLSWAEALGIAGSVLSGAGGVAAAWIAVRKAKRETRAQVEHECLERIAALKGEQ